MSDHKTQAPVHEDHFEHGLLVITALLLGIGAVMVYSATVHSKLTSTGDTGHLLSHLQNIGFSILVLLTALLLPLRWIRKMAVPGLFFAFAMMVAVLLVGETVGNSTRWIELGVRRIQPGEFAKLFFIIWLAHSLAKKGDRIKTFYLGFLPYLVASGVFIMLYMLQPDFGSSIFLAAIMMTMLVVAGARWTYTMTFAGFALPVGVLLVVTNEMRMTRIKAFLNPQAYAETSGFQLMNSMTSIASNGPLGSGLGNGGQSIAGHLPESHTDFIFSVIGEELGFVGVALVAGCFLYILYRGTVIAYRSRDPFARLLAFGAMLLVVLQAAINIAVNAGIIPTKGLPLPLISYGGSNMVTICAALGLVLNVSRSMRIPALSGKRKPAEEKPETTTVVLLDREGAR